MYRVLSNEELEKNIKDLQEKFIMGNSVYQTMNFFNDNMKLNQDINHQQLHSMNNFQNIMNSFN